MTPPAPDEKELLKAYLRVRRCRCGNDVVPDEGERDTYDEGKFDFGERRFFASEIPLVTNHYHCERCDRRFTILPPLTPWILLIGAILPLFGLVEPRTLWSDELDFHFLVGQLGVCAVLLAATVLRRLRYPRITPDL